MKHIVAIGLLLAAFPAAAMIGILVSSSQRMVGGTLYWACVYDVAGSRVEQLVPISAGPCPPTINM